MRRAVARRRLADDLPERAAEGPQAGEADIEADVGDAAVGLAQEEHRALDPPPLQVTVRRLPEDGAEAADEVRLGDMGHRGHGADVERLGVGAVHGVAGAQQAPVQILDVPAHGATLRHPMEPMRAVSAVEREPAQLVAQPLVVEHKVTDLPGEPGALPLALQAAGRLAVSGRCRSRRPDRVRRSAELVGRHVTHRGGLTGRVRRMPGCPTQVPGRGVGMAARRAGLCPRDITARPGSPEVDRVTRSFVLWPRLLEVVQHVLRAVSGPDREQVMVGVLERSAATHGDEPWIPDLGEDHRSAHLAPVSAKRIRDRSCVAARTVWIPLQSIDKGVDNGPIVGR